MQRVRVGAVQVIGEDARVVDHAPPRGQHPKQRVHVPARASRGTDVQLGREDLAQLVEQGAAQDHVRPRPRTRGLSRGENGPVELAADQSTVEARHRLETQAAWCVQPQRERRAGHRSRVLVVEELGERPQPRRWRQAVVVGERDQLSARGGHPRAAGVVESRGVLAHVHAARGLHQGATVLTRRRCVVHDHDLVGRRVQPRQGLEQAASVSSRARVQTTTLTDGRRYSGVPPPMRPRRRSASSTRRRSSSQAASTAASNVATPAPRPGSGSRSRAIGLSPSVTSRRHSSALPKATPSPDASAATVTAAVRVRGGSPFPLGLISRDHSPPAPASTPARRYG